jgi:hypothetical protein
MRTIWITAALLASVGTTYAADVPIGVLSAPGGRYVFGQISARTSDRYLLDTQTGRLWQITCFDSPPPANGSLCGDARLMPMEFFPPELAGHTMITLPSEPHATAKK